MTSISFNLFKGEMPLIDPKKLELGRAVSARNCDFGSGSLDSMMGLGDTIDTASTGERETLSRHPYTDDFLVFGDDVDLVRGPIANDQWNRVYWTGESAPRYNTSENQNSSYLLGVPAPEFAPSVSVTGTATTGAIDVDCSYIITYVTRYGEEGPPSSASSIVTRKDGQTVQLSNLPGIPSGEYNIEKVRIYRTEGYGTFNYVGETDASNLTYSDNLNSEGLGEPCPSLEWDMPESSMTGLVQVGNGILAGFFGNTLCFCEPYYPHAWPVSYQYVFPSNIVGIAITSSGLLVLTNSEPWVVAGSHPSGMYQQKIDSPLACVSKGSIVDMGEYILYASNDGIAAASGGEAKLISANIISPKDFNNLSPDLWKAFRFDDRYFVISDGVCISFSPNEGFKYVDIPNIEAGYVDTSSGDLFVLMSDGNIKKWGDGSALEYTWKSGVITVPPRLLLSCGRLDSDDGGTVELSIFFDGVLGFTKNISSSEMFRLPAKRYREIQVLMKGVEPVHTLSLATSTMELI